jgi:hypothetical protein
LHKKSLLNNQSFDYEGSKCERCVKLMLNPVVQRVDQDKDRAIVPKKYRIEARKAEVE